MRRPGSRPDTVSVWATCRSRTTARSARSRRTSCIDSGGWGRTTIAPDASLPAPRPGARKIGVTPPAAEADGPDETPGWPAIRSFARTAETLGLDSVWMFDHLFDQTEDGSIEGMHESWTIVSAVAATTERVEIGTLVMCSSFRSPGLMAQMA